MPCLASASAVFISNMLLGGSYIRWLRTLYPPPALLLCAMQWKSDHVAVCHTYPNSSSPQFFHIEEPASDFFLKSHKKIQEQVKNQQTLVINL